jgi:ribosomal-protein-alanine N-acetyltransferase
VTVLRRALDASVIDSPQFGATSTVAVNSISLSPMQPGDLNAVMEIERRSFPNPWSPGLFLHELKLPFSKTLLARQANGSNTVLGYVCRWLVGDEVHILNLAVGPERRRSGIGRMLVESVIEDAQAHGVNLITLEVRRGNEAAVALYRSFGFKEAGVRRNYYGRGEDAIVMSRVGGAANGDRLL